MHWVYFVLAVLIQVDGLNIDAGLHLLTTEYYWAVGCKRYGAAHRVVRASCERYGVAQRGVGVCVMRCATGRCVTRVVATWACVF